ncbi:hypothetical protein D3C76_1879450 [compost metagenome]
MDSSRNDRAGEAGQLDQLAEHGAEQKHWKVQLDKADHLFHEHAGEGRGHGRRVSQ